MKPSREVRKALKVEALLPPTMEIGFLSPAGRYHRSEAGFAFPVAGAFGMLRACFVAMAAIQVVEVVVIWPQMGLPQRIIDVPSAYLIPGDSYNVTVPLNIAWAPAI